MEYEFIPYLVIGFILGLMFKDNIKGIMRPREEVSEDIRRKYNDNITRSIVDSYVLMELHEALGNKKYDLPATIGKMTIKFNNITKRYPHLVLVCIEQHAKGLKVTYSLNDIPHTTDFMVTFLE